MARKTSNNKTQPTVLDPAEFIARVEVLEEIVLYGVRYLQNKYETWQQ